MIPNSFLMEQFDKSGVKPLDVRIIRYNEESFGDFVAEVKSDIGLLRVERERGQCFIDYFDEEKKTFVRGDIKWPKLLPIFNKGAWELSDLIRVIKASS
jgi:hypothetical protein